MIYASCRGQAYVALWSCILVGTTCAHFASSAEPEKTEIVIAEGVGVDVERARTDAYRNAVRQAVGAYVDSETIVANDQLITDKVITLSPAFVDKVEAIAGSESNEDGLVRVRVRAWVRITKLLEELAAGRIKTRTTRWELDTSSLVAELMTKTDQQTGQRAILNKLFEGYPESCLTVSQSGKVSVDKLADGGTYLKVPLLISPNKDAFSAFATRLCEAIAATGYASGDFKTDANTYGPNPDFVKRTIARSVRDTFRRTDGHGTMLDIFPKSAHEAIIKSCDGDGKSSAVGINAAHPLWDGSSRQGIDSLYYGAWSKLRENRRNDRIVICLASASTDFRRLTWKWFHIPQQEADVILSNARRSFLCRTRIIDSEEQDVVDTVIELRKIGVRDMYPNLVWIAPFYVNQAGEPWYAPELRFTRTIAIDAAEVSRIAGLVASLEKP